MEKRTLLNTSNSTLDKVGGVASLACAIHCAFAPLFITLVLNIGLGFLASEWIEWLLFGLSASIGILSLCWGYRQHRGHMALAILAAGLSLLAVGRLSHHQGHDHDHGPGGMIFLVIGGTLIACAHYVNYRLCQSCQKCHDH